jgi:membrane-bound lytic murein transglycosylase D
VDQLKSWNNIGSQNIISVGQKLVILKPLSTPTSQGQVDIAAQESEPAPAASKVNEPSKVTHSVAAGETLFSISNKYGVSVDQLKSWNNIGSQNIISVGQKLVILKP